MWRWRCSGERLARALMTSRTESEAVTLRTLEHEGIRLIIELQVTIGRSQQQQNHIAGLQAHTFDFTGGGDKPAGVLNRWIETLGLSYQVVNADRITQPLWVSNQRQQRVTDQPGGGS